MQQIKVICSLFPRAYTFQQATDSAMDLHMSKAGEADVKYTSY